jgi:hypothetical protein
VNDQATPWDVQSWPDFRDTSPEAHRWLIDGLLPEGALVFLAGPPKQGKTWLGLALALAVATGKALFGEYAVPKARDVLYVALEGSRVGLRARIGALARGLDLDPDGADLDRLHVMYRPRPFDLVATSDGDAATTAAALADEAARLDAALVVIDVLRAAARFKENDQAEFARVRDAVEPLLAAGRSVPLLHHFGKLTDTQKERSPGERMSGTGAMYGALDVGFLITRSERGARRLRVEIEARDFAAPDAVGVRIAGNGTGEHGGFTYTDTAQLVLDESAAEGRDLAAEIEALFADGAWRTVKEVARKGDGIGANVDEVRATLTGNPDHFVDMDPRRVDRHPTANPWGTLAMLAAVEEAEKVTRRPESPGSPHTAQLAIAAGGVGDSPTGEVTKSPTPSALAGAPESLGHPSHLPADVARAEDHTTSTRPEEGDAEAEDGCPWDDGLF